MIKYFHLKIGEAMKYFKFNYFIILVLTLSFPISMFAQQSDISTKKNTSLKAGSWSLQFGYNNKLGFNSFNGTNISAKYHYTDNSALRFGINIDFANRKNNKVSTIDVNKQSINENTMDLIDAGIVTDYIYYFSTKKDINLFISSGANIGISYGKSNAKNSFNNPDSIGSIASNKTNGWFGGVEFSVGVEWFVAENFSIHGEYITKFRYQYLKHKNTSTDFGSYSHGVSYSEQTEKNFYISPDNVLIGVSLYF